MCLLGVCQKFSNDDLAVIQYSLCTIDSFLGYQKQKVCVCVYVCVYVCVCVREKEIVRMENKRAEIEEDASQICFIHSSMLMYTHMEKFENLTKKIIQHFWIYCQVSFNFP